MEKLTRGLVLLEREEFEVKRELEQIKIVRDSFAEHLGQTENLNPADWSSEELPTELTKALARVDQAKAIYSQSKARLLALRQAEEGTAAGEKFGIRYGKKVIPIGPAEDEEGTSYAEKEYGVTKAELKRFVKRMNAQTKRDIKAGNFREYHGDIEAVLKD